jgi:hypothetical protein
MTKWSNHGVHDCLLVAYRKRSEATARSLLEWVCSRAPTSRLLQLIGHLINPGLNASLVFFAAQRARSAGCADHLVAQLDRPSPLVGYDVGEMKS